MFAYFIYFIIVLLIYNTYQPSAENNFSLFQSLALFLAITLVFFYYTHLRFKKLIKRLPFENPVVIDQRFTSLQTHLSIFAIGLFAIHIYVLDLPAFFFNLALFQMAPTLVALICISIFVIYLAIIWSASHPLYQELYRSSISKHSYILSNISFSIPVLLPWTVLSGVADFLNALPFEWPKNFLSTGFGQAVYFIFFLFAAAILGPVMIQRFWRCKPLEKGRYRERIEALCQKAGMKYSNILYWPIFGGRMITAGVMGLVGRFRYILVTNGLLNLLTSEEIDAVIAHEIGHIKRHHLMFYLLFFIGYPFLYFVFYYPIDLFIVYTGPPNGFLEQLGLDPTVVTITIFNLIMIITFLIYFRYIFGYFMRNFERQADTYVYSLFKSAQPLISTFQKIASTSAQPADKPNWHHFSIKERIDFLNHCEDNRSAIRQHNRKVRNSIVVYVAFILFIAVTGYHLNFSAGGESLRNYIYERSLLNEIHKSPNNAELYSALGMIYYSREKYREAIKAYQKSLQLNPNQDQVLNNLSWLYATCDEPAYRDPQKALILAIKAAHRNPSSEILDTLAESYYINNNIQKAIQIEMKALAKSNDRKHYEAQLRKFTKALK
jgi:Zn-dependent protease with chaperone function